MLTKTNIEYGEFNWQIYRGCLHKPQKVCPVPNCWAEKVSKRQGWDFHKPELLTKNLFDPLKRKKPARILVNFSGDIFGDWVIDRNIEIDEAGHMMSLHGWVTYAIEKSPQHTFLFLTKAPQNIWKITWPDNCWMGATCWDSDSFDVAFRSLQTVSAKHKWLSMEPLLDWTHTTNLDQPLKTVDWVVLGSQSNPDVYPHVEAVNEIVEACDKAGVSVWLKNNLDPLLGQDIRFKFWKGKDSEGHNLYGLRQEFPADTLAAKFQELNRDLAIPKGRVTR